MATVPETVTPLTPPTDKPDALYEFVDGEWKETPRMGGLAGLLASALVTELNLFARPARLGMAVGEVLFRLGPDGPARRPDVSFLSSARWTYPTPLRQDPAVFDVVPDLAVAVNSPNNTLDEILDKVKEYFFAGVRLVWVIVPRHRQVFVYEAPDQMRLLSDQHELEGGDVLPGFRLPLAVFFDSSPKIS